MRSRAFRVCAGLILLIAALVAPLRADTCKAKLDTSGDIASNGVGPLNVCAPNAEAAARAARMDPTLEAQALEYAGRLCFPRTGCTNPPDCIGERPIPSAFDCAPNDFVPCGRGRNGRDRGFTCSSRIQSVQCRCGKDDSYVCKGKHVVPLGSTLGVLTPIHVCGTDVASAAENAKNADATKADAESTADWFCAFLVCPVTGPPECRLDPSHKGTPFRIDECRPDPQPQQCPPQTQPFVCTGRILEANCDCEK